MRSLVKLQEPVVLEQNAKEWLQQYLNNRDSNYRKTKYRHEDIKDTLRRETVNKCAYCESKIGHNTPGISSIKYQ